MKRSRVLVVGAVAGALVMVASPAHAVQSLTASDYSSVWGSADVTFPGQNRVDPINNLKAWDRACDGNAVYVRFIVYTPAGQFKTGERRNDSGCGTTVTWDGLYIHDREGIKGVRLEACVDSIGTDECDTSSYADNPHL